jgi:hypothetical protein
MACHAQHQTYINVQTHGKSHTYQLTDACMHQGHLYPLWSHDDLEPEFVKLSVGRLRSTRALDRKHIGSSVDSGLTPHIHMHRTRSGSIWITSASGPPRLGNRFALDICSRPSRVLAFLFFWMIMRSAGHKVGGVTGQDQCNLKRKKKKKKKETREKQSFSVLCCHMHSLIYNAGLVHICGHEMTNRTRLLMQTLRS